MKKTMITINALCIACLSIFGADSVTSHGTIGMLDAQLVTQTMEPVGTVEVWNTSEKLKIRVSPNDGYLLSKVYVYVNHELPPPPAQEGEESVEPNFGEWPFVVFYKKEATSEPYFETIRLEDLGLDCGHWGPRWMEKRTYTVGVRVELKTTDESTPATLTAWGYNPHLEVASQRCGWGDKALAMRYEIQHPKRGMFHRGPVNGLSYSTPTQFGTTGEEEGFLFFPGEMITFSIGNVEIGYAQANERLTPLDIFNSSDTDDPPVANLMRLLLSLDVDGQLNGPVNILPSVPFLEAAMVNLGLAEPGFATALIDFEDTGQVDAIIDKTIELAQGHLSLVNIPAEVALAHLKMNGDLTMRRNISKSPLYETDKPKLDIMPMWVPAQSTKDGPTLVTYYDKDGSVIEERNMVKPLFVSYTEMQPRGHAEGFLRGAADVITAVSLDDGSTWREFNISHTAKRSSFTLEATGEKFPGNCLNPKQKIEGNKILVVWTSAYARGGKPRFAIKTDDNYPYDNEYAVEDHWGVRGRQGSVNYDLDDYVGDQGIGEIPYYALWACRGVVDTSGNITWFKPERLTSGRRDAFYPVVSSAPGSGFAVAWQEDPGGLRPGQCLGGGNGWSGATVHKKTDIWYSYITLSDFAKVDYNYDPSANGNDEHGEDEHGMEVEIMNRPKWLVPMSLPVRVSDNNTVNTENLKVQLDETTGLPVIGSDGRFIPLEGALEADYQATEHETEGGCGGGETDEHDPDHGGQAGTGGGWGMARYAYMEPGIQLADQSGSNEVWDGTVLGEYRPDETDARWYRFVNKPGKVKTVAVTADGRVLDGDTGACRPFLKLVQTGDKGKAWALLGYEETKGLGTPPEGDHEDDSDHLDRPEPDDSGKNVIYHAFLYDQPDRVSAGEVVNLPALDDDMNLIPIYYKDAQGQDTEILRQYKTENARRVRFLAQPLKSMHNAGADTIMVVLYKQGREGQGKPSDIFAVRVVVPESERENNTLNPFRFENFELMDLSVSDPDANGRDRHKRLHINLTGVTAEETDPSDLAGDGAGNTWGKVSSWRQYQNNLSDESFMNPYSDAKGHRGFIKGKKVVIGYSWTPNWGYSGADHMDFYVRRSFDGGRTWKSNPKGNGTVHNIIERNRVTGHYYVRQEYYGPGKFEPARNVSRFVGNTITVTDPRLVPPMGTSLFGETPDGYLDDTPNGNIFYVAFGTAKFVSDPDVTVDPEGLVSEDIYYARTTDGGETWDMEEWVINPDSPGNHAGETVERFPVLAEGTPHQGHAQLRMHPSGTRMYAIWHQWTDGDEMHLTPHDFGDDIWFRRIDFMSTDD